MASIRPYWEGIQYWARVLEWAAAVVPRRGSVAVRHHTEDRDDQPGNFEGK